MNGRMRLLVFLKNRKALTKEVNKSVNLAIDELKGKLTGELELIQRRTEITLPEDIINPFWSIKIDNVNITFGLNEIEERRTTPDEIGQWVYDENVSVDSVVKKIIINGIINA